MANSPIIDITDKRLFAAYRDALAVQDACNLQGVLRSWASHAKAIREATREAGTAAFNQHPVNVLFASKVASLTGCESPLEFSRAYRAVEAAVTAVASLDLPS